MLLLPAGYLLYPAEVLHSILNYLCVFLIHLDKREDPYTNPSKRTSCKNSHDVVNLSATCRYIRLFLGPYVFQMISVVRKTQIESLLQLPKVEQKLNLSDEILHFKTIHNFVTTLETNTMDIIPLFPSLERLIVLANCSGDSNIAHSLRSLTISAGTLLKCSGLSKVVNRLNSLHMLCAFHDIDSSGLSPLKEVFEDHNLKELNLYFGRAAHITYDTTLDLIVLVVSSSQIQRVGLHVARRSFQEDDRNWPCSSHLKASEKLLNSLLSSEITSLSVDISILVQLQVPNPTRFCTKNSPKPNFCFTLIDPSFAFHSWHLLNFHTLAQIFQLFNVKEFQWKYGEVIDESHLQALDAAVNTIARIRELNGCEIDFLQLEKCWSVADDTLIRQHLKIPENHSNATIRTRYSFNSPRYRRPESYAVVYLNIASIHQLEQRDETEAENRFWTLQLTLLDFQQYCLPQRKRSSIWD